MLFRRKPVRTERDVSGPYMAALQATGLGDLADLKHLPTADLFCRNDGTICHKWTQYFEYYERYFARFRGKKVRFLEIGVSKGGSLKLWRDYLGADAVIFGIDVNPECAALDGRAGKVRIGSQVDADFLCSVVAEMGGVDVVLDDGSHVAKHVRKSFEVLFPLLADGGIYAIEDLCTSYWENYGGGYSEPASQVAMVKGLIDDLHRDFHSRGEASGLAAQITGLHVHASMVFIDTGARVPPRHVKSGREVA